MKTELPILKHQLYAYMDSLTNSETAEQYQLRQQVSHLELANMQISTLQAQFIRFLVKLIIPKHALELGTYCGYSAMVIAQALPDEGTLDTCDINEKTTQYAINAWQKANLNNKITLHLAPALNTLNQLLLTHEGKYDFIFIDADKTNYLSYYQLSKQLLSPRGILLVDNVFWDGKVLDANSTDRQTQAIREFNLAVKNDADTIHSIVPLGDGLMLIQKK